MIDIIYIYHLLQDFTISKNPGFKAAPPTRNPSISSFLMSPSEVFSVTLPPYMILVFFDTSAEIPLNHFLMNAWTS